MTRADRQREARYRLEDAASLTPLAARLAYTAGIHIDEIARITGLTQEEVTAFMNEIPQSTGTGEFSGVAGPTNPVVNDPPRDPDPRFPVHGNDGEQLKSDGKLKSEIEEAVAPSAAELGERASRERLAGSAERAAALDEAAEKAEEREAEREKEREEAATA